MTIFISECDTHSDLKEGLASAETKPASTKSERGSFEGKYDSESTPLLQLSEAEQETEIQVAKLKKEKKHLERQKSNLQIEVAQLERKIGELNKEAIKIAGRTKRYPAGYLTAGVDFPLGRYKVFGGSSNFVVYDASGRLRVNIVLGGRVGVDEYIYNFEEGDEVVAHASFKLVLIK